MTLGADTPLIGSDPDHCFIVCRLLHDGRWVGSWSEETKATVEFRGEGTCGWEGQAIAGDCETGREDDLDRDRVYDDWMEQHVRIVARPYIHDGSRWRSP